MKTTLVILAGILVAGGRAAAAQGQGVTQDTMPLTVIVAVFPDSTGATQAAPGMKPAEQAGHVASYAVVSKDRNGKVKVSDRQGKKGGKAGSARANNTIDGVVALLGRPRPSTPSDSSGNQAGNKARISNANANKIEGMLPTGSSAIIVVVPAPYVGDMETEMQQAHANQVLDAPLLPE